jgi:AraC-like DNA-binding protein
MLAPGHGHTLRDAPDTKPRDLMEMVTSGAFGTLETDARPIQRGTIDLICGCFNLHGIGASLPLTALPAVVHVGDLSGDARPWLSQTIQLLAVESRTPGPGSATVVNRLCDALFVYVLRSHLATLPAGGPNWLRALVEPQIGPAIEAIHANPAAAWTVAGLADHSGMSRSAFAARFTQAVGEGPMQYLTRWRLQKAAAMLQRGEIGIAQVASNSGYGSEAAFSKAFKRALGMTPGAYRRAAMAAVAD